MTVKRYRVEYKTAWYVCVDIDTDKFPGRDVKHIAEQAAAMYIDEQHSENCWTWTKEDPTEVLELDPDGGWLGIAQIVVKEYDRDNYIFQYDHWEDAEE